MEQQTELKYTSEQHEMEQQTELRYKQVNMIMLKYDSCFINSPADAVVIKISFLNVILLL